MSNKNTLIIFTLLALILGGAFYVFYPTPKEYDASEEKEEEQIFCTLDAKLCPDGSYVGRVPPNCEFAPCPPPAGGPEGSMMEDGTITE
jgi:hypothetical protein